MPGAGIAAGTQIVAGSLVQTGAGGTPPTGGGWTPAALTNLAGWWDASDLATITAVGGKVSQWSDKSPAANHLTQPTAASQPATGTRTIGGHNALEFQQTPMAAAGLLHVGDQSFLAVVLADPGAKAIIGSDGTGDGYEWRRDDSGVMQLLREGVAVLGSSTTVLDSAAHAVAVTHPKTAPIAFYLDGAPDGTGGTYDGSWAATWLLRVGGYAGGSGEPWRGLIAELVAVDGVVSATDLANWNAYCHTKWGVAATPPPWTPTSLPGLTAWYDASDPATITAATGKVSQWGDKSSLGHHLTQPTAAKQPTTGATINGRAALTWTPANNTYMDALGVSATQPFTVYTVMKQRVPPPSGTYAWKSLGSDFETLGAAVDYFGVGTTFSQYAGVSHNVTYNPAPSSDPAQTVAVFNGATSAIYYNGRTTPEVAPPNPGDAGTASFTAGLRLGHFDGITPGYTTDGLFAEVVIQQGTPSPSDLANWNAYCHTKWGTPTWTPASLPGLFSWLDADDAATITASAGKVSQWSDKSPAVQPPVIQGAAGAQPAVATVNGRGAILFDGVDDMLASDPSFHFNVNTMSFYCAFRAVDNFNRVVSILDVGTADYFHQQCCLLFSTLPTEVTFRWGEPLVTVPGGFTTTTPHIYTHIWNGAGAPATRAGYVDGSTVGVTTSLGSAPTTPITATMLSFATEHGFSHTYVCELLIYSTVHTAAEQAAVESYLRAKWGTP